MCGEFEYENIRQIPFQKVNPLLYDFLVIKYIFQAIPFFVRRLLQE